MKPYNVPNIIPAGTVMNATINSSAQQLWNVFGYAIQIVWTGTPTGSFKLQASDDSFNAGIPGNPNHWSDITDSSVSITAAGSYMWNVSNPQYVWVRVVYTDTSSGASTAVITSATFNGKGF